MTNPDRPELEIEISEIKPPEILLRHPNVSKPDAKTTHEEQIDVTSFDHLSFLARENNRVRRDIALILTIFSVSIIVIITILTVVYPDRATEIRETVNPILNPLLAIYATIVGFYFAERK